MKTLIITFNNNKIVLDEKLYLRSEYVRESIKKKKKAVGNSYGYVLRMW